MAALRLAGLSLLLGGLAALAWRVGPDVDAIRSWIDQVGVVAPLAFVLLYLVLTVALVPGSVLTAAGGLMFGAVLGTALTLIGATVGATAAFVIARRVGRGPVERLTSGRVARVDRWLADRGVTAVLTLRLVPLVPFSAANYAAGVTAIRLRDYVIGTAVGIVPGTVAYTVVGARFADPTDPLFLAAMGALAALAVGGSAWLRRSSRRRPSDRRGATADGAADRERASTPA